MAMRPTFEPAAQPPAEPAAPLTRTADTRTGAPTPPRGREHVSNTFPVSQICRAIRERTAAAQALALNAEIDYPPRPGASFPSEPDADALAWFRRKGYAVGFDYRDVWAEEHQTAFTVAKAMSQDVLENIRAAVDSAIANGDTYEEFARDLTPTLQRLGWWGKQEMVDPVTGETRMVQLGSPRRLRTIYETNLRTARAAGQWARIQRRKLTHPYLLYLLGPSRDHREQHVAWRGICLPVDDPWWDTYYPPSGWGCLCWVRQISTAEYRRLVRDGVQVPAGQILDPETGLPTGHIQTLTVRVQTTAPPIEYYEWLNKRTGETIQVARGCDPGWDYHPGKHRTPPTPTPAPTAPVPAAAPEWPMLSGRDATLEAVKDLGGARLAALMERTVTADAASRGPWMDTAQFAAELARAGHDGASDMLALADRDRQKALAPLIGQTFSALDVAQLQIVAPAVRAAMQEALRAARPTGGAAFALYQKTGKGVALAKRVAALLPDSWVERSNARGPITVQVSDSRGCHWDRWWDKARAKMVRRIRTSAGSTAEHEFIHAIQHADDRLQTLFAAEHLRRTAADEPELLYTHSPGEVGRPDKYVERYAGREYGGAPLEVITMAYQALLGDDVYADRLLARMIRDDPELLKLALGAIFHYEP